MTLRDILGPRFLLDPFRAARLVVHLPQFIRLFYRLFVDPRISLLTRFVPLLGLLVMMSPPLLELDFVPILGEIDNLLIIYLTLKLFVWLCPPELVREHVERISHGT